MDQEDREMLDILDIVVERHGQEFVLIHRQPRLFSKGYWPDQEIARLPNEHDLNVYVRGFVQGQSKNYGYPDPF